MTEQKSKGRTSASPTPHDLIFKQFLNHPGTVRDFVQLHLPAELLAICDLDTLKLECGNFVEESLRPYYSDVLYSLKTAAGEGYIHVLIEHQSTPDQQMAFRLLRYAVAAMQRHLDAGHKKLPLVIPVLFYAGRRSPYPYAMNWLQAFNDPVLAGKIYSSAFPLVDITVIPDDEIMRHRSMAALTLMQKHIHQRDLSTLLDGLTAVLVTEHITGQQLISLINYLIQVGETSDALGFVSQLAQRVPQHKGELMTIAEQLKEIGRKEGRKEGREEGREEGRKEGREKGREESRLEIAYRLLRSGLDLHFVIEQLQLTESDIAKLNH